MRRLSVVLTLGVMLGGGLAWISAAQIDDDGEFAIRNGKLWQELKLYVISAIETPDLAQPGKSPVDITQALARVSEVGANSICFDLPGLSADGATLDPAVPKAIETLTEATVYRRMGAICRVFGPEASADPKWRKSAIRTVAKAMKGERRVVYWIDGPGAAEMAAEFHRLAPTLVVAAERGGDIDVVSAVPAKLPEKPILLVGAIPPRELRDTVHCVLQGKESYNMFETAMANPVESQPWTPDNSTLSEQERAEGFISLFDGKTLNGWWILGKNRDGFVVEDGTIKWKSVGAQALLTRDRYDNFVLRLEWKIGPKGNSGIYLRAPRINRQSKIGMEFQLQGDAGEPITNQTTGAIYVVAPPLVNAGKPAGEWNTLESTCYGPQLKAVLNGQTVQDLNLDQNDELRYRLRKGFIGLQDHGMPVSFRSIRIKKL